MDNSESKSESSGLGRKRHLQQHHRRVPRACDECRLRKTKCDGLKPCSPCHSSDRYCTYNSVHKNTGAGARTRILEERLRRARAYINEFQRRTPSLSNVDFDALLGAADEDQSGRGDSVEDEDSDVENLTGMLGYLGTMTDGDEDDEEEGDDGNDNDHRKIHRDHHHRITKEFYGAPSGLAFLHRTRDYFAQSSDSNQTKDTPDAVHSAIVHLFDAPLPKKQFLHLDVPVTQLLPPQKTTASLVEVVFAQVFPLFNFLDESSFQRSVHRIYEVDPIEFNDTDHDFLPLLYSIIGLGYLFSREAHKKFECRGAVTQGMRHFIAAREMVDPTNCRDITSLQVLLSFILFLISTARLGSAHAYVGLAAASAMRQGLHFRSTYEESFTDIERDLRRKVFWAVLNLDMYVSTVLGLPVFIDLSSVDPAIDVTLELALEAARTDDKLNKRQASLLAASAKHIELLRIVSRGNKALFPRPPGKISKDSYKATVSVSFAQLRAVESAFKKWGESASQLPLIGEATSESVRFELEMAYYFSQIVLYRPFLHALAEPLAETVVLKQQQRCALICIETSYNTISKAEMMLQKGYLSPASWTSVYTVFLSVVCVLFLASTGSDRSLSRDAQGKIQSGIRVLASAACSETGSRKCLKVLKMLIGQIGDAVQIDVDAIVQSTTLYCRSTTPLSSLDDPPLSKVPSEPAQTLRPFHHPSIPSISPGSSNQSENIGVPPQTQHVTSMSHDLQDFEADWNLNQFPEALDNDIETTTASQDFSYPAFSWTPQPSQYSFMPQSSGPNNARNMNLDDHIMEVPYAHNLNWQYQQQQPQGQSFEFSPSFTTGPPNTSNFDDGGIGAIAGLSSQAVQDHSTPSSQDLNQANQLQLTPEEIAAYMRLDPRGGSL